MHLRFKIALSVIGTVVALSLLVYYRRIFPKPVERALEALRDWWLPIAKKIGHGQTLVLLTLVYYTGISLTSLMAKCMRKDFLMLKGEAMWLQRLHRKRRKDTLETLVRQF